jgi:hypothetical protein
LHYSARDEARRIAMKVAGATAAEIRLNCSPCVEKASVTRFVEGRLAPRMPKILERNDVLNLLRQEVHKAGGQRCYEADEGRLSHFALSFVHHER